MLHHVQVRLVHSGDTLHQLELRGSADDLAAVVLEGEDVAVSPQLTHQPHRSASSSMW